MVSLVHSFTLFPSLSAHTSPHTLVNDELLELTLALCALQHPLVHRVCRNEAQDEHRLVNMRRNIFLKMKRNKTKNMQHEGVCICIKCTHISIR